MEVDFKNLTGKKLSPRKNSHLRKTTLLVFCFSLAIIFTWISFAGYHLLRGRSSLYEGKGEVALQHFLRAAKTGIFPELSRTGTKLSRIVIADKTFSYPHQLQSHSFYQYDRILKVLIEKKLYTRAKKFGEEILKREKTAGVYYHTGTAHLATGNYKKAVDYMLRASQDSAYHLEAEKKLNILAYVLKDPDFSTLRDRNGLSIQLPEQNGYVLRSESIGLEPILEFYNVTSQNAEKITYLSIDLSYQKKAFSIAKRTRGSLLLLDTTTGEILAMATGNKYYKNPLSDRFESGRLIQLPIIAAAIEKKLAREIFPLRCQGSKKYGDFTVYGTRKKEKLNNFKEAFLKKCNVLFADIAEKIEENTLKSSLNEFIFKQTLQIFSKEIKISGFKWDNTFDKGQKVMFSTGHYNSWTTFVHSSYIAAMVGTKNAVPLPHLTTKNLELAGERFQVTKKQWPDSVPSKKKLETMKSIFMENAKQNSKNNKTGYISFSSGGLANPASLIILGFMPAGKPQVAFCFVIPDSLRMGLSEHKIITILIKGLTSPE